jgi:hypothetical protein
VAVTVAVEFSRPVVAGVIGKFILEMVVKLEVVGKVVDKFTLVVGENYKVAIKVAAQFNGSLGARVIGKFILEMVANGK